MTITRQNAERLKYLYDRRDFVEKSKKDVDLQFWLRFTDDSFKDPGYRADFLNAFGGRIDFARYMTVSISEKFDTAITDINREIFSLGGEE